MIYDNAGFTCPICGCTHYEKLEIETQPNDEDFFYCKQCSVIFMNPNNFSKTTMYHETFVWE